MLEINNISKSYKNKKVLNSISMSLENGLYGLLGPNGAGKSTLMNIVTDNLLPDRGSVSWNGRQIGKLGKSYRQILGFTPQQQGLYDGFSGRRFLSYLCALKNIPKPKLVSEIERAASAVNLTDELDKRLGAYSGGMKQRILIAQAILGEPELIILDEPTAGLDPKERVRIRNLIRNLAETKIVLIATHVVSDIENIADEVIILKAGDLVAKSAPRLLIEAYAPNETLEDVYMHIFGEEVIA